jgi:hypothetical protein
MAQPQNNQDVDQIVERYFANPRFLELLNSTLFYTRLKRKPLSKALGSQTIGTTQVAVPHGLARTPNVLTVQMTSAGTIWQSTAADSTNIYLKADSASRTCNVEVQYIADNLR